MVPRVSMGDGKDFRGKFKHLGNNVIIEDGVRIFHPENISIGDNVYIGHDCFIEGYHKGPGIVIGNNSWIGPMCYMHGAGGIEIGESVGIGPCVKMLTSYHITEMNGKPLIENDVAYRMIVIEKNADIGIASVILPGAHVREGWQVGSNVTVHRFNANKEMPANMILNRKGITRNRR